VKEGKENESLICYKNDPRFSHHEFFNSTQNICHTASATATTVYGNSCNIFLCFCISVLVVVVAPPHTHTHRVINRRRK
jgi:hypothetical protein